MLSARDPGDPWYKCNALHGVLRVTTRRMKREAGAPRAMAEKSSLQAIPALPPQR